MTVSNVVPLNSYVATGSNATYTYTFRLLQAADLVVQVMNTLGVVTTLTLTTNYTVSGVGQYSGGTVTLTAGNLTAGYTIILFRNPANTQTTSLQALGNYDPTSVETALDLLTMQQQAQSEQLAGALAASVFEVAAGGGLTYTLPSIASRANKALSFDAGGNVTVSSLSGGSSSLPAGSIVQQVSNMASLRLFSSPVAGYLVQLQGYYTAADGGDGLFVWNASDVRSDNGGTIIQVTGIVTGRWNRVVNQSIAYNILWFGAKGDGATNDTTALTNAVASGFPVLIPAGKTILYTPPLIISVDGTAIIGENRYTSILKPTATAANAIEIGDTISSAFGFVMRDVRLTGNGTCTNGIVMGQASPQHTAVSATFERCYIEFFNATNADGMRIVAGWWLRVSGCTFESNYNNFHIPAGSATTTILIDQQTTIRNSVQHGVFLEGIAGSAKSITLRTVSLEAAGAYAFYSTVAQPLINIEDCYFELNHGDVYVHGSSTAYQYAILQMDRCRSDGALTLKTLDLDYVFASKIRACPGFNNGSILTTANVNVTFEQMNGDSAGDFVATARSLLGTIYARDVNVSTGRDESYASSGNFFEGHICSTQPTAPTVAAGGSIGVGGSVVLTAGSTDTSGRIELTSGTSGWSAGKMCRLTFNKAFNRNPIVTITAGSTKAGTQSRLCGVNIDVSTTWLDLYFETAETSSGLAYWHYHVLE